MTKIRLLIGPWRARTRLQIEREKRKLASVCRVCRSLSRNLGFLFIIMLVSKDCSAIFEVNITGKTA